MNINKFCQDFLTFQPDDNNAHSNITALYYVMNKVQRKRPQYFDSLKKRIFRECSSRINGDIYHLLEMSLQEFRNNQSPTTWNAFVVPFIVTEIYDDYAQENMDKDVYTTFKCMVGKALAQHIKNNFTPFLHRHSFNDILVGEELNSTYIIDEINASTLFFGAVIAYFIKQLW